MIALPAIGVCGFGRCGSTMLMTMLDAGGIPPVDGSAAGSYELPQIDMVDLAQRDLNGRAVKLLDAVLHEPEVGTLPSRDGGWRMIWLSRSHVEQARSQVKFLRLLAGLDLGPEAERRFRVSYASDEHKALAAFARLGCDVLLMEYEKVLADPLREAMALAAYLLPDFSLDVGAAALAVHERDARCRPDLAVEIGLTR